MRRFLCGLVALGLVVGGAGQAKTDYVFTTIDVPDSFATAAAGINNSGQIVGWYSGSGFVNLGFVLGTNGYTTFSVPGSSNTHGYGINQ